ncbi:helix-turn-helix domain-containing protein [Caballeronia grimmiae]|uniref:helix-turn-helix domain-containing protein n=1 Tax=Caballeronia grimmiae TaxID=1071679 RepID=UPI0038B8AB55
MRAWPLQGRRARTGGGQARQRIAFLGAATRRPILLAEADENEGKQSVGARQADIADSLGVTREAVAAALRRFRDAGLVETRYRRIDVLNIDELRSIVGSH